ncbi:MAG: DUF6624 domain-containing protein [Bacteroidota bacterium]
MKYCFPIFFLSLCLRLAGQTNPDLSNIIDSLKTEDQFYRNQAREIQNSSPNDSLAIQMAYANMRQVDSLVQIAAKEIFYQYGFPGEDRVGATSCHNYWLLVQHCDTDPSFQEQVLTAMLVEVKKGNASGRDYAYLLDRLRVNTNQKQVYGTQMRLNADSTSFMPQPLLDPEQVNERRRAVGLGKIEYYIQTMNERYFGALQGK